MVPWGGGQGRLGKRELLVGHRSGELLRREERGGEKGGKEQDGNFGLLVIFVSTRPNLMLICSKCKDKLELMIVTLIAVSFFFQC